MHRNHVGGHGDETHWREVFQVPRQLVHEDGVGNVIARVRHQNRVAVFGAACHVGICQVATGARFVIYHHRLAREASQGLAHQTG